MKFEFLKVVYDVIGNVEYIYIEESGVDSLFIYYDDV